MEQETNEKKPYVEKFNVGAAKFYISERAGSNGSFYTVDIKRIYKNEKTDEWHEVEGGFAQSQLENVSKGLAQANNWIANQTA